MTHMHVRHPQPTAEKTRITRSQRYFIAGACVLILVSVIIFTLVISGKTRRSSQGGPAPETPTATTTAHLVPRTLDGVLVEPDRAALRPRAFMIDNQVDARPWSGIADASLVIESPVEGGITRFMAMFDASATTTEIGPVRSARPYFVDWADGWGALYFHVGGSPEALDKIKGLKAQGFTDIDEISQGRYFQRLSTRVAPHSTYTDMERVMRAVNDKNLATSTVPSVWHFEDAATSTPSAPIQSTVKIAYGGSYSVTWAYSADRHTYVRQIGSRVQRERDGDMIEASNVIVMKTDARVLDEKGRLSLRTTGGGEAMIYRNGRKYVGRWQRSKGEPIRFEGQDGTEFLLNRGKTWIQVTTDDLMFAGLEQ